jgi:hypothetical protein
MEESMASIKSIAISFAAAAVGLMVLPTCIESVRSMYEGITSPDGQLVAKQFTAAATWAIGGFASYAAGFYIRSQHSEDGLAAFMTAMPFGFFGGIASGIGGWHLAANMLPQLAR